MNDRLLIGAVTTALALLLAVGPVHGAVAPTSAGAPAPPLEEQTSDVPLEDDDAEAPYTLSTAYPNPFRERTRFDLSVKRTQHVSVSVYNILGQQVRSLYEGQLQADRSRTFTIEARGLPSGLYLYRVSGETFTAARRVTLVQ